MTIYDIIDRCETLRKEQTPGSVTPERVGGIISDALRTINKELLAMGSIGIHKIYASEIEMLKDARPLSDISGNPLKAGELVVTRDTFMTYKYEGDPGKFTKISQLNSLPDKVGCSHYDKPGNRFLLFPSSAVKDSWILSPSDNLILGIMDMSDYQRVTSEDLNTRAKDMIGAINELGDNISDIASKKVDKVSYESDLSVGQADIAFQLSDKKAAITDEASYERRTSCGTMDIETGVSAISKIYGRTDKQLIDNGNFQKGYGNWIAHNVHVSLDGGILTWKNKTTKAGCVSCDMEVIAGHRYLIYGLCNFSPEIGVKAPYLTGLDFTGKTQKTGDANVWNLCGSIVTSVTSGVCTVRLGYNESGAIGTAKIAWAKMYDLTELGLDAKITTIDHSIEYFGTQYCEGIYGSNLIAKHTTGFNQFSPSGRGCGVLKGMHLTNTGRVAPSSSSSVAWLPCVSGHYIIKSHKAVGYIGWSAFAPDNEAFSGVPVVKAFLERIPFPIASNNGYLVFDIASKSDYDLDSVIVHLKHSYTDFSEKYTEEANYHLSSKKTPYGVLHGIGKYRDEIDLINRKKIRRIGFREDISGWTPPISGAVLYSGTSAYYALAEPVIADINISSNAQYINDFGIEALEYQGAVPCVVTEYYNNLVDKLRNLPAPANVADVDPSDGGKSALRPLYETAGAVYNVTTGYYELNGLTDITEEQMRFIYVESVARGCFSSQQMPYQLSENPARTNLPFYGSRNMATMGATGLFYGCKHEVINLGPVTFWDYGKNYRHLFANCRVLKKIIGVVRFVETGSEEMFIGSPNIEEVNLSYVNKPFDMSMLPLISMASILFLIKNAINGSNDITITLHPAVKARADVDSDIQEALVANGHITLITP